jgi:hypothetical protein
MTDSEFRDWLQAEVQGGRMTAEQRDDLLQQKQHFDAARGEIEQQFRHQVVGYVNGRREVDPPAQQLLAQAQRNFPGRMVYFEPVGFDLC